MAVLAAPVFALTPPAMKISVGTDTVTVDSTGSVTLTNCASCTTVAGSAGYSASTGLTWSGTIDGLMVAGLQGRSQASFGGAPLIDIGITSITTGASGGTITISLGDTGFPAGEGPSYLTVGKAGAATSQSFTGYADSTQGGNNLFGQQVTLVSSTGTSMTGTGPTSNPFSMTLVEAITLPANSSTAFTNDISLQLNPYPPLSLSCPTVSGQANSSYSSGLSALGGISPYIYSIVSGQLPTGLTLNADGSITGTPTIASAQTFTAQVQDSSGLTGFDTITASCTITIASQPKSLSVICPTPTTGIAGAAYNGSLVGTGGNGSLTYGIQSGTLSPLTLNTSTGAITGNLPSSPGSLSFVGKVSDSSFPTPETATTGATACGITIYSKPTATCAVINAVQGVAITAVTLTGSGGAGGAYTFSATGLPSGLTMDSTGKISGTPTVNGTFPYTVTITDKSGNTGTINCSVTVLTPPTATCPNFTGVVQNSPMTPITVVASGGAGAPYTFTATGLPTGVTISSSGTISGTPTVFGTSQPYTIVVTDKNGNTGTLNCSWNVLQSANINPPNLTVACPKGTAEVGLPYSSQIVATGGTKYTYSISAGALPAGLALSTTGLISGTPTTAGTSGFTIKVVDVSGAVGYSSCSGTCSTSVTSTLFFNSPSGSLGNSKAYSIGGTTVTAYGFNNNGTATALYAQNNIGVTDDGVGIDAVSNNQIDTAHFVQLDLTAALAAGATNIQIAIAGFNQCQGSESYDIYGSNTLGSIGTLLVGAGNRNTTLFSVNLGTYKYLSVRAHSGNVLLEQLSFSIATTCSIKVAPGLSVQCPSSSATLNKSYSSTVPVSGGTPSYTFALSWGTLPAGLTLNPTTGVISGTPTTSQTSAFQIMVTDSLGAVGYSNSSGSCSNGTTISYGQNGSAQKGDGDRGTSITYTANGLPLKVYGYRNDGSQTNLFANNSWNNPGIGINEVSDNGVDSGHFVQCDISGHTTKGATSFSFSVNSQQWGATYDVYGSNTLGQRGTLLESNVQTNSTSPHTIPNAGNYKYLCVTAHGSGHVVIGNVNCNYPGKCAIDVSGSSQTGWGQGGQGSWGYGNGGSNGGWNQGGCGQSGFGEGGYDQSGYNQSGSGGWGGGGYGGYGGGGNSGGNGSCW
jgi:large repetitive protein